MFWTELILIFIIIILLYFLFKKNIKPKNTAPVVNKTNKDDLGKRVIIEELEDQFFALDRYNLIKYLNKDKKFEIYFIMGADNLIHFHKWYKWKSISKKCNILVFDRLGYKAKSLKSITFKQINEKNLKFINFKKVNISSSQIRKI